MATVYSLICWGGRTGKTVSISASTDVVTLTNHGLRNGFKLWPSGTLPSELNVLTPVYARSTAANTFTLHTSAADAIANTGQITFAGSSTYAAVVLKSDLIASTSHSALAPYGLSDLSRWGDSGSERIYDGIPNALAARINTALSSDDEVFEIGESFDVYYNTVINTNGFAGASLRITTRINDIITPAYHYGVLSSGFRHICTSSTSGGVTFNSYNVTLDGFQVCYDSATNSAQFLVSAGTNGYGFKVLNCIIRQLGSGQINGVWPRAACEIYGNILVDLQGTTGAVSISTNTGLGAEVYLNLVTRCGIGFVAASGAQGIVYNNLSIGNTVNWAGSPSAQPTRLIGNIGGTTDNVAFTVTVASTTVTLASAFGYQVDQPIFMTSSGSLPSVSGVSLSTTTPYYIKTIIGTTATIAATRGGSALTFDGAGSGTHKILNIWASSTPPTNIIDFSSPSLVFADWSNGDFRPAGSGATPAAQALQVDATVSFGKTMPVDISGNERPNYNGGGAEAVDVGPFEYDHGYGPHPATHTLTLTNVVTGSRILIRDQANTTTHYDDVAAGSTVEIPITVYGDSKDNWIVKVRKASGSPYYIPWETLMTATAGSSSIYVSQIPDE